MSEKIVQLNEEVIKGQIKELVRGSVEETLNELLEAEAEKLTQAARYERNEQRQGYRSGHYSRNLTTTSGDVTLKVPKLKGISFETAIIERYRRRESSVEEALIGKWGRLHRGYLKEHHPIQFNNLVLSGNLWAYLADLNEQAQQRMETLIVQLKSTEGITETLKAADPISWTQRMNSIAARAEEIIREELIYNG